MTDAKNYGSIAYDSSLLWLRGNLVVTFSSVRDINC